MFQTYIWDLFLDGSGKGGWVGWDGGPDKGLELSNKLIQCLLNKLFLIKLHALMI